VNNDNMGDLCCTKVTHVFVSYSCIYMYTNDNHFFLKEPFDDNAILI